MPRDAQGFLGLVGGLRTYVAGTNGSTIFETEFIKQLNKSGVTTAEAQAFLNRWDELPERTRVRFFGDLATAKDFNGVEPKPGPIRGGRRPRVGGIRRRLPVPDVLDTGGVLAPPDRPERPKADYLITYEGMHCIDETGADWWWSDEIYVVTSAVHIDSNGDNVVRTERHPFNQPGDDWYGDVDSHETFIGPRAAVWDGSTPGIRAGVSLTTVFMEHEFEDPEAVKKKINVAVTVAAAAAAAYFAGNEAVAAVAKLEKLADLLTDGIAWLLGIEDDQVNEPTTSVFEFGELDEYSRLEGQRYNENPGNLSTRTNLRYHFTMTDTENDYVAAYQVRRTPELSPPSPPIVE